MQRYSFFGNIRSFSDKSDWFLGKICLDYARNANKCFTLDRNEYLCKVKIRINIYKSYIRRMRYEL